MKKLFLLLILSVVPFSAHADLSQSNDFERLSAELSLLTCEVIAHQSAVMVFDLNAPNDRLLTNQISSSFESQNCDDVLEKSFDQVFAEGQEAAAARKPLRHQVMRQTLDRIEATADLTSSFVSEETLGY